MNHLLKKHGILTEFKIARKFSKEELATLKAIAKELVAEDKGLGKVNDVYRDLLMQEVQYNSSSDIPGIEPLNANNIEFENIRMYKESKNKDEYKKLADKVFTDKNLKDECFNDIVSLINQLSVKKLNKHEKCFLLYLYSRLMSVSEEEMLDFMKKYLQQ